MSRFPNFVRSMASSLPEAYHGRRARAGLVI